MKGLKIITAAFFILISLQSCDDWFQRNFQPKSINQHGYITDTLDNGIAQVKITVYKADNWDDNGEETDMVFYTDETGYYKIKIKDIDYVYRMKMTHEQYIYPNKQKNLYPQITPGITDEDINYQMVKKGPVKIEGDIRYVSPDLTITIWLDSVKVSVLKRPAGNTSYPDNTGIYAYTNENGIFYIEYPEDKNYEFFLKPEKEGYYYDGGYDFEDCSKAKNYDPGYIISWGFEMKKTGE